MLGAQTLTVIRPGTVTYVDGVATDAGDGSTFEVQGSLQPMTGRDLLVVPEGQRHQRRWKLYTTAELKTAESAGNQGADRVVWQGKHLVVESRQAWSSVGLSLAHYRYQLVEDETGRQQ